jgi:cell wall-associated NlpC family hydrolase
MQGSDGNLVLYHDGRALWASGGQGAGARAAMQGDGNFVIYNGSTPKWSSNTADFPGASLRLQDDGNLVIYHQAHAIWDRGDGYLGDTLIPRGQLRPDAFLLSPDHQYRLAMQTSDGNLVLYHGAQPLWSSGSQGAGAYVAMQGDGNLVIYNGPAKWSSNTADFPSASLRLQDDGNLVIYHAGHAIWTWSSGYLGDTLIPGGELAPGAFLRSADHRLMLVMQPADGNLVLYQGSQPLWSTGAQGAGARLAMQGDGNLVIYNGPAKWASGTAGHAGARLAVQNDSNVVIYQGATPIWSRASGSGGSGGGQAIVNAAASQAGIQYCFAGGDIHGPNRGIAEGGHLCAAGTVGFDCTGLTLYAVYQATGKVLSHDGHQGTEGGQAITDTSDLQPGDLVFFGGTFSSFQHSGVYAGNGEFWDANDWGVPVQKHTMAWMGHAMPFVGGARYWH